MRLRKATLRPFRLPLEHPLTTAHGVIRERSGLLIRIEDESGQAGFGEATPLVDFGTESLPRAKRAIVAAMSALIEPASDFDAKIDEFTTLIEAHTAATPTARAALECALFDLLSRREERTLADYWRSEWGMTDQPCESVSLQALVGGDTPSEVAAAVGRLRVKGFRAFKLKVATMPSEHGVDVDVARVAALREAVGPHATIRLDANEGWTRDVAMHAMARLENFGVDYVEQPVVRGDLDGLEWLDRNAAIDVAADEALLGDGFERFLARAPARILIVKPAAIGGYVAARKLHRRALEDGFRIVWSSLIDGAVSRRAALHLAAALPSTAPLPTTAAPRKSSPTVLPAALEHTPDHEGRAVAQETHGLATGALLSRDFVVSPVIHDGRLPLPTTPGLGLDEHSLGVDLMEGESVLFRGPPHSIESRR